MRAHTLFYSSFAVAALFAAAPTAAQQAATTDHVRLAISTPAADAPAIRTLAVYEFNATTDGMPTRVTIADSAGTLVAAYRLRTGGIVRPMRVNVSDSDILLQGETPRGTLTLVLYDQNDPVSRTLAGTWALGSRQGELRGYAVR
jgi:hypothetical protein